MLYESVYFVTRWSGMSNLAWVATAETKKVAPRSNFAHWLPSSVEADHAWALPSIPRPWPDPSASPIQTDEYARTESGGLLSLEESENCPAEQLTQAEAPVLAYFPQGHSKHAATPSEPEKLPN